MAETITDAFASMQDRLRADLEGKAVGIAAKKAGREFESELVKLPSIDWDKEVDRLSFDDELKEQIKIKLNQYLKKMD